MSVQAPRPLLIRLLALQYWYDRLSERRRLLLGVLAIVILSTSYLYVLGLGSIVLASRAEEASLATLAPTSTAASRAAPVPTLAGSLAELATATPTHTPAVDEHGNLIEQPDVPEIPIIAVPQRAPVQPLKPRVLAPTATPVRAVAATPTPVPIQTRPGTPGTAGPTPVRTPTAGAGGGTAAPVRTAPAGPPPTATRPPINTPVVPTVRPANGATPTPTPRR